MIAFASSITDAEAYRRCAEPGIRRAAEADSEVIANPAAGSIFRSYNLILDMVAERQDLEALVLVHQDAEIATPDFCRTLRAALHDPDVGVVGCAGAVGVRSIAWWEGSVTWASFTHRYPRAGRRRPAGPVLEDERASRLRPHRGGGHRRRRHARALTLDREDIRFDESLGQLHGYDFDFCLQVRAAGRKVVAEHLPVVHHHSLDLVSNPETWIAAHMRVAEKWAGRMPTWARPEARGSNGPGGRRRKPPCAHGGVRRHAARGRQDQPPRARARRGHHEHQLADDRPAAAVERSAQATLTVIAFGCAIALPEVYDRCARRGIDTAAEPESARLEYRALNSINRSYNLILDKAAAHDDLEALVLVHQDTEIVDPDFCRKVRQVLSDPDVGVAGCIGARGVRSIAWWEGSVSWASFIHRYGEFGGGDLPGFMEGRRRAPVRPHGRGRRSRRLPAGALAVGGSQRPFRRVARTPAWIRRRLLPPGPRRRPQGDDP